MAKPYLTVDSSNDCHIHASLSFFVHGLGELLIAMNMGFFCLRFGVFRGYGCLLVLEVGLYVCLDGFGIRKRMESGGSSVFGTENDTQDHHC